MCLRSFIFFECAAICDLVYFQHWGLGLRIKCRDRDGHCRCGCRWTLGPWSSYQRNVWTSMGGITRLFIAISDGKKNRHQVSTIDHNNRQAHNLIIHQTVRLGIFRHARAPTEMALIMVPLPATTTTRNSDETEMYYIVWY